MKHHLPIGPTPTRINSKIANVAGSEGFQARCPGCTGMRKSVKDTKNVAPTQPIPQHQERFCPGCTGMKLGGQDEAKLFPTPPMPIRKKELHSGFRKSQKSKKYFLLRNHYSS